MAAISDVRLVVPPPLATLEAQRDELQAQGRYADAAAVQASLETGKRLEEERVLADLAARHADAQAALDIAGAQGGQALSEVWHQRVSAMERDLANELDELRQRHVLDLERLQGQCASESIHHHASRTLLDLRCKERHLRRQCCFTEAEKIKRTADELEMQEIQAARRALTEAQGGALHVLMSRHEKELGALRHKQDKVRSEALLLYRREMDTYAKRQQAARLALARAQGQERLVLEQAMKGWFNARKMLMVSPQQRQGPPRWPPRARPVTAPVPHPGESLTGRTEARPGPGQPATSSSTRAHQIKRTYGGAAPKSGRVSPS